MHQLNKILRNYKKLKVFILQSEPIKKIKLLVWKNSCNRHKKLYINCKLKLCRNKLNHKRKSKLVKSNRKA